MDDADLLETADAFPEALEAALLDLFEGSDDELRAGIAELCAAYPRHADAIAARARRARSIRAALLEGTDRSTPRMRIGPYRVIDLLGEGGMGSVFLAEQREPIQRRVALKVIKLGMDSRSVLARFEVERQALALMSHDNIAKVLDAGMTEKGQPYFVMEYVQGSPITDHCDRNQLSTAERLELFLQVCSGVEHAHQKGVIHRDLKPSNILVSYQGERATPKIIDFGLARATQHHIAQQTVFTERGQIIGTPEYMSPEHAEMGAQDIDTRTDVYSLGVILYELLTGELPLERADLRDAGLVEIQRRIREVEPRKPSTRITERHPDSEVVARSRRTSVHALCRELRGDLDWITMKALEKDRARRYGTTAALADDLRRHLRHEPVEAGPPSAAYRVRKLVRRYRGQFAAAALVLVTLIAGLITSLLFWDEARANAAKLTTKIEEYDMLANVVAVETARNAEQDLYPAWPHKIAAMERWFDEHARPLLDALPRLRATLADLEARPSLDGAQDFLRDTLARLVPEIEGFRDREVRGVEARLRWARQVREMSITRYEARWREAREAIAKADDVVASRLYAAAPFEFVPQFGLVPIGMNPVSKFWEFYHLRSAAEGYPVPTTADYDERGGLKMREGTGMVFVLVPGGRFVIGAQSRDPKAPRYDPDARKAEENTEPCDLFPFFLSKYELTQGQWTRLTGGPNPSEYPPGRKVWGMTTTATLAHPVDNVPWNDCFTLATQHGLRLPTEMQWEYACRAGTDTPWHCGSKVDDLEGFANVLDKTAGDASPSFRRMGPESFADGYTIHAPVGTYRPNRWAFFDMHGNVWEWCLDGYADFAAVEARPRDGLRDGDTDDRVIRGGSYSHLGREARSSCRSGANPVGMIALGVRPSRVVF